ncbi:hypothetical protein K5D34_12825 [Pseudomonas cichorii]|nr:hypothetical protein [Pseudomonas cichorii]MBX8510561.1 hypothetical protein [Pseudomonas cichorii]MBX8525564.1 hypothetical protein [Pseudomonas cichorii]
MLAKIYKCFIASPGDTVDEREICDEVFHKINTTIGQHLNFRIESKKWENDSRPSFGTDGQSVINSQLLKEYDLFIGLMWARFGAETPRAGSGTEEEFDQAYKLYKDSNSVEIMIYFNKCDVPFKNIDPTQILKVQEFQKKISSLGGLYKEYNGSVEFKEVLYRNLHDYFQQISKASSPPQSIDSKNPIKDSSKDHVKSILEQRLEESLKIFSNQPAIWVDPFLSRIDSIDEKASENYKSRVKTEEILATSESIIIKAPPQFGLTSLANYFVLEAWKSGRIWLRLNAKTIQRDDICRSVSRELGTLGITNEKIDCIVLDSWRNTDVGAKKLLRNLCSDYPDTPVVLMQTTEESPFQKEESNENINRDFEILYLLALPRSQVRKVVYGYNEAKHIGDENRLLEKILRELDALNIHRTPLNCITLLKVSESNIDDSPVNRTKMIELILFALFNLDELPTYKTKPDLKDCEYALGRFCEILIKDRRQTFSRVEFLENITTFCEEKLLHLEVSVVFDTLFINNIITKIGSEFCFRATYWIYYFAARRMYTCKEFKSYILDKASYASFPEIIEFYTGIDRDRGEVLEKLTIDLSNACDTVDQKTGLPSNINPLASIEWSPSAESIATAKESLNENITNSNLPDSLKDDLADKNYNQLKPYDQSIQYILEEYSLSILIQKIKASSRALRNSDYVDPNLKRLLLNQITRGWKQVSLILFALSPLLASQGRAAFEGQGFILEKGFGNTLDEKLKRIYLANPYNIVKLFSGDLYSNKIAPLIYDRIDSETDQLIKHNLIIMIINERPINWKNCVEKYISSQPKNSFYLFNVVQTLTNKYKFDFASNTQLSEIKYLLKSGYAKHEFGKKPTLVEMRKISNSVIPQREFEE